MTLNKLSIVIPTTNYPFNRSNIIELLFSAENIGAEVILVLDSCESNDFNDACRLAQIKGSWLKVVQTDSRNPGGARNAGLKKCTSPWVVFWDSDDQPNSEALIEMVREANVESKDIAIGRYAENRAIEADGNRFKVTRSAKLNKKNWQLEVGLSPGIWRFAFKYDSIKNFVFPNLRMGEDQVFIQRVLQGNYSVYLGKQVVYNYRIGNLRQLTANKSNLADLVVAADLALKELEFVNSEFKKIAKIMIIKMCLTLIFSKNCSFTQAVRYFYRIVKLSLSDIPMIFHLGMRMFRTFLRNGVRSH